jgi:hypothetical protein
VIIFEHERELSKIHGAELKDFRFFQELTYKVNVVQTATEGRQVDCLAILVSGERLCAMHEAPP